MGEVPQDLKYAGERTQLVIGRNCRIRENATLHCGTEQGGGVTRVGDNCLVMAGAHVGHDAQVGNNVILANYAGVAGHVVIEDNVIVGALSGIHQFVRVGEGAIIGGVSRVTHDVIPFGMVANTDGTLNGLNLVGLKRRGMAREEIAALRAPTAGWPKAMVLWSKPRAPLAKAPGPTRCANWQRSLPTRRAATSCGRNDPYSA